MTTTGDRTPSRAEGTDVEADPDPGTVPAIAPTRREILEALSGLLAAMFVAVLSSTIVANALPTIVTDLGGSQNQYTWVVTATLLASTASTPIWGKLADLVSKKLLVQVSITIFTVGSVLAGLSGSVGEMIAWRALQGLGMGGLQALVQIVIATMISPRERGRYAGLLGGVMSVAIVGGPLIGGVIVGSPLGWRWCFFVGVPLVLVALVLLQRTLHLPVVKREVHIDYLGAALIVGGVSTLLIWVTLAGDAFAWGSGASLGMLAAAVGTLALAIWVESRAVEPVVPLRLFRDRTTALSVIASTVVGTAMFGSTVFLAQYLQISRGYGPTEAGLLTIPMVVGLMGASAGSGRLISNTGRWKHFLVLGAALIAVGLGLLATVDHTTPIVEFCAFIVVLGLGVGMSMQNLVLAVQNVTDPADLGAASSTVVFFRTLGGAIGVSVLGAVLASRVADLVRENLAAAGVVVPASGGGEVGLADLNDAPPVVAQAIAAAYGDATGHVFAIAAVLAIVPLVAAILIKEVPLRSAPVSAE